MASPPDDSPRLSVFASHGDRIRLCCYTPGCPYGCRTLEVAPLIEAHGDITLEDLKRRARCGQGHGGRITAEIISPAIEGEGGFTDRSRR
jgi:hypothetical protein